MSIAGGKNEIMAYKTLTRPEKAKATPKYDLQQILQTTDN
jgi:hypothetical protein